MHFQKCNFTCSPRLSHPLTAATAVTPITWTQAAIGNQALLTLSCRANIAHASLARKVVPCNNEGCHNCVEPDT